MKAYVILPIYNVLVSEELIDKKIIDDYIVTSSKLFFEKYKQEIITNSNTYFAESLYKDIDIPVEGMLMTRPLAQYLIIKEYDIDCDYNNEHFEYFRNTERGLLNNLILSLRLTQKGRLQVNKCYLFSPNSQGCISIDFSTNLENMYGWLSTKDALYEDIYELNTTTIESLKRTCGILKPNSNSVLLPIVYFMQYYNTVSSYDKIIKLAIVLESSILAGLEQELNYRLKIRICAFLKQDYKKQIDLFYQLRSSIVHNGYIDEKSFKNLRKFLNDTKCSEMKAVFIFVKDYIEPLVRNILYKALEYFVNNDDIKDYKQLFTKIDNEIIENIIK